MRHLFILNADLSSPNLTITGQDAHHIARVLRSNIGDRLTIADNNGSARAGVIQLLSSNSVTLQLDQRVTLPPEPSIKITVAQALGKGDKFDQVVQHGTEVGACAFVPLITERTLVKIDDKSAPDKLRRWSLIAKGAAEQSGRAVIPIIHPVVKFADCLRRMNGTAYILDSSGITNSEIGCVPVTELSILVGPEGGFSQSEIELAQSLNVTVISLGPYVLRTETAALVALACLIKFHNLPTIV